jgi:hypothetical protein
MLGMALAMATPATALITPAALISVFITIGPRGQTDPIPRCGYATGGPGMAGWRIAAALPGRPPPFTEPMSAREQEPS